MSLNTTPRTWTTAELVTAVMMNTEIRDALIGVQAAWTSYSPAWTSSGTAPVLNNGTLTGAYLQLGKTVLWRFRLVAGSTTTFGTGNYFISLPSLGTPATTQRPMGSAVLQDTGVNTYIYQAVYFGDAGPAVRFYSGATPAVAWAATVPFTFGNTDSMELCGTYEVP